MALFKSFVLGEVRKSVANITMGIVLPGEREVRCVIPELRGS